MAGHHVIDAYLATLARRLPADTVEELADGLTETWQRHLAGGLEPAVAAQAAIAEFGPAEQVADEFVAQAPGRRTARLLLASGPALGLCWGVSLVTAKVWTWPVAPPVAAAYVAALVVAVATLLAAATARHSYRRTRLGLAGALALVVLDAAMIASVFALAPVFVWPMTVAVAASLLRIGFSIGPTLRLTILKAG